MMDSPITSTCPVCHQPIRPEYYFCPNCGAKLVEAPLATSVGAQIKLYAFSIVLPWILFIMVTKWKGIAYARSKDPKAKQMGTIAWILIILSTILTFWLAYVFTQQAIQSSISSINADLSF